MEFMGIRLNEAGTVNFIMGDDKVANNFIYHLLKYRPSPTTVGVFSLPEEYFINLPRSQVIKINNFLTYQEYQYNVCLFDEVLSSSTLISYLELSLAYKKNNPRDRLVLVIPYVVNLNDSEYETCELLVRSLLELKSHFVLPISYQQQDSPYYVFRGNTIQTLIKQQIQDQYLSFFLVNAITIFNKAHPCYGGAIVDFYKDIHVNQSFTDNMRSIAVFNNSSVYGIHKYAKSSFYGYLLLSHGQHIIKRHIYWQSDQKDVEVARAGI